jgi:hypothetical protein
MWSRGEYVWRPRGSKRARGAINHYALVDAVDRKRASISDDIALQRHCRAIAEGRGAGLVEAKVVAGVHGRGYMLVHKKLQRPAFTFMGMLVVPGTKGSWVWAVMSGERGTTGVREAIVTGEMLEAGTLTLESYETSWAQDPYDPQYRGVDRSTLRYMSDAEEHDRSLFLSAAHLAEGYLVARRASCVRARAPLARTSHIPEVHKARAEQRAAAPTFAAPAVSDGYDLR